MLEIYFIFHRHLVIFFPAKVFIQVSTWDEKISSCGLQFVISIYGRFMSIIDDKFHSYVNSKHPNKLEIKDNIECSTCALYLDILLKWDVNDKIMIHLHDKLDYINFFTINFPYLCTSIIPSWIESTMSGKHLAADIQGLVLYTISFTFYIRSALRFIYDQLLIQCWQLTKKLNLQRFLQSRLQTTFRKFCDLVCQYNLPSDLMLSVVFHTNYYVVFD
jgi:hypothetical protein